MTKFFDLEYNLTEIRRLAKRYPEITLDETEKVLDEVVRRLEGKVVEKTPKGVSAEGGLSGSIVGEVVSFGMPVKAVVGTPLEYGEVIEHGRRPGKAMPPVEPIVKWARSILGITDAKEARSVGFAIARKIAVKGFEGAHMFEEAWKENEKWAQDQLRTIPGRVIRRIENGVG